MPAEDGKTIIWTPDLEIQVNTNAAFCIYSGSRQFQATKQNKDRLKKYVIYEKIYIKMSIEVKNN